MPILRWIASKPRRNIHFEVFHVAQGDSNLAASVIVAVVSGHFHMIPRRAPVPIVIFDGEPMACQF